MTFERRVSGDPPAVASADSSAEENRPAGSHVDGRLSLFGPLRHRLLLLFAGVLLPSILLASYQATVVYDEYAARIRQTVRQFAVLASSLDRGLLTQSEQLLSSAAELRTVTESVGPSPAPNAACNAVLDQLVAPFSIYAFLTLYDSEGRSRCVSGRNEAMAVVTEAPWFRDVQRTKQGGSSGYLELPASGEPGIIFTHPVLHDGSFAGALALGIRLQFLVAVTDESGLPAQSVAYLLDQNGRILAGFDAGNGSGAPPEAILQSVSSSALREFTAVGKDGLTRLYAASTMPYYDLHVLFGIPEAQLLDPLFWKAAIQVLVILGAWILALLAVLPGARWVVTRWTDRLTDTARAMSRGNLEARADLAGAPEELRLLGETLAGLAARVQRREAELGEALAQHKTMLREVHHRVKNNLQTVTSLLNLHAKGPRAAAARQVFADVQIRINALALVHRHLYESEDMRVVALRPFLTNLCRLVQDGSGVSPRQVSLVIAIEDMSVSGDTAVPVALLVTEVLTNAFKHGFPAGRRGEIRVQLARATENAALLTIEDNGVGQPDPGMEAALSGNGIGFSLINAFARQLDGTLTFEGPPGTSVSVRFPLERRKETSVDADDEDFDGFESRRNGDAERERSAPPRSEDRGARHS